MTPILIPQRNLPLVTYEVIAPGGAAVDLTGATVQFAFQGLAPSTVGFQHPASIVDAAGGKVSYQFADDETAEPGTYAAQWTVTKDGIDTLYPGTNGGSIPFTIVEALPQASPSNIIYVRQMREPVRAILGDFSTQFPKYNTDAVDQVVRTCLRLGKVPGQSLAVNLSGITPGLTVARDIALLTYHAAKTFVLPNAADYSYKTRAMSERFGRQDLFLRDLEDALYELESDGMFYTTQSFYGWVNALTGVDIWSVMSDMVTHAPVATVNIGRAGVTVNTM